MRTNSRRRLRHWRNRSLPPSVAGLSAGASDIERVAAARTAWCRLRAGLGEAWNRVLGLRLRCVGKLAPGGNPTVARTSRSSSTTLSHYPSFSPAAKVIANRLAQHRCHPAGPVLLRNLYGGASFVAARPVVRNDYRHGLRHRADLSGSGVVLVYTLLGDGFLAVSWTDFFQALLMVASTGRGGRTGARQCIER